MAAKWAIPKSFTKTISNLKIGFQKSYLLEGIHEGGKKITRVGNCYFLGREVIVIVLKDTFFVIEQCKFTLFTGKTKLKTSGSLI